MKDDLAPAAFRLMNSGLKVHTHERKAPQPRPEGSAAHLTQLKIQRIRALDGEMPRREICSVMRISYVTLRRYLGRANKRRSPA